MNFLPLHKIVVVSGSQFPDVSCTYNYVDLQ